jgi:hypothetical protein
MKRVILEFEDDKAADALAEAIRALSLEENPDPRPIPVAVIDVFAGNTKVRLAAPPTC